LLTQLVLPEMRQANSGVIVFVTSSGAAPYLGAYEVFKTAQAELCNTLAEELENTEVYTYAISPGLVKTDTAMRSIEQVAAKMGMTTDQFYAMNHSHMLSAEEAGCGFALSVLAAKSYNGQEIGSIQVLLDSGLEKGAANETATGCAPLAPLVQTIITVFEEQRAGWMSRNLFERQWIVRDFKKTVGMSVDQFGADMSRLKAELAHQQDASLCPYKRHFEKLRLYFQRQHKLLQGFEKDPVKRKDHSDTLTSWIETLTDCLRSIPHGNDQ
jgi:hypothetical protein